MCTQAPSTTAVVYPKESLLSFLRLAEMPSRREVKGECETKAQNTPQPIASSERKLAAEQTEGECETEAYCTLKRYCKIYVHASSFLEAVPSDSDPELLTVFCIESVEIIINAIKLGLFVVE